MQKNSCASIRSCRARDGNLRSRQRRREILRLRNDAGDDSSGCELCLQGTILQAIGRRAFLLRQRDLFKGSVDTDAEPALQSSGLRWEFGSADAEELDEEAAKTGFLDFRATADDGHIRFRTRDRYIEQPARLCLVAKRRDVPERSPIGGAADPRQRVHSVANHQAGRIFHGEQIEIVTAG